MAIREISMLQLAAQHVLRICRPDHAAQFRPQPLMKTHDWKDDRTALSIESQHVVGPQSKAQSNCQDAASGCTGDEVELSRDRHAEGLFQRRQYRRGEGALDA